MALTSSWGIADFVIASASPAELAARLRLLESSVVADSNAGSSGSSDESILEVGDIVIDTDAYTVRLHGQTLDLTYKEFELLKYLAANQGRGAYPSGFTRRRVGRGIILAAHVLWMCMCGVTRQAWR